MARVANAAGRRAAMLVLQCLVVLVCVGVTGVIAVTVQERTIRTATADRVLDVSHSLAELDEVHAALNDDRDDATARLQPITDLIASAAGVDYVVIADADGVRITHPTPGERGRPLSTDPAPVLAGETYLGTEDGTLGPTLRAKVPIVSDGTASDSTVIGIASVGILEATIAQETRAASGALLPWVAGASVAGCLAAALLTHVLNRRVRRGEEAARELEVQRRVAGALREQTHDFHTRLHVVHGLVAEGEHDAALAYIGRIAPLEAPQVSPETVADTSLRALLEGLAAELGAQGARLEIVEPSVAPPGSVSDAELTAVANLCRNAGEAGATLVRVWIDTAGDPLRIVVEDDGPGVDPVAAPRLFEAGVSTKHDDTGTGRGVGLTTIRRSVAARGGGVEVGRSRLGGARFAVDVPATRADAS